VSGKTKEAKPAAYHVESHSIVDLQAAFPGDQNAAIAAFLNAKHAEGLTLVGVIGDGHMRFVFAVSQ